MVSTTVLTKSIVDPRRWPRPLSAFARQARQTAGSLLGARYVDALGSKAHFNDRLLASSARDRIEAYRISAVEHVEVLARALADAGLRWRDIRSCLEIECGYGRIVRELRFKVSARAISVCDSRDEAVRFTASEFGVKRLPVVEMIGPDRNGSFDFVFSLSLYTELDRPMIEMNLAKASALTRIGGVVAFATKGRPADFDIESDACGVDPSDFATGLDRDGYFHAACPPHLGSNGLTWMLPDEVMRMVAQVEPDLSLIAHYPRVLDGQRDLFVYRKF